MGRVFTSFPITDFQQTKIQVLNWANQFNIFCFLDTHQYRHIHTNIECLLGVGSIRQVQAEAGNALTLLNDFLKPGNDWVFGHFSYDLKNEIESLSSGNDDNIKFPDLLFYVPEVVIRLNEHEIIIGTAMAEGSFYYEQILASSRQIPALRVIANIQSRFTRDDYIKTIHQLQEHIRLGDCYEINFCQEFFDKNIEVDPLSIFWTLSNLSPSPFAAFYRVGEKFLMCASPERYLRKEGILIFSQPIKGTWQRDLVDKSKDTEYKISLLQNSKERSENVMVVDLVRNDLSKICLEGSVEVEELFGVYSFPHVHQMISTVRGILRKDVLAGDVIEATFPMGSMTGVPKLRVMELIEKYERSKRGIFSGAVGYFSPDGDFDFNVVIRTILYNRSSKYLSFQAGSGITFYSNAESEYEECLLKVQAIKKVLTGC